MDNATEANYPADRTTQSPQTKMVSRVSDYLKIDLIGSRFWIQNKNRLKPIEINCYE